MTMRIIVTGGTFDKQYDELRGELTFKDSHLPAILKQARITAPIVLEINQLIDSLHMQDANRQHILASCRAAPEERIVIVHGTDTMAVTACVLGEADLAKTIVLTGAMIPYAFGSSDGLFNLGSALSFVQVLPPGVYIAMNGRWFPWNDVRKNRATGTFEPLPGSA
jgi:L-asparaginase